MYICIVLILGFSSALCAMETTQQNASLEVLPNDVIALIYTKLDLQSIASLGVTNKRMNQIKKLPAVHNHIYDLVVKQSQITPTCESGRRFYFGH